MQTKQPETQAKGVEAVDRALRILQSFETSGRQLTLTEISARTGLYKSTILRLMVSLEGHGFIQRFPDKTYRLGAALLRLGGIYRQSLRIEDDIRPALRRLLAATGESASFYIEQDGKRVCLFRENSLHPLRDHVAEGETHPLKQGAAGHILVDYGSIPFTASQIDTRDLPRFSFGERTPDVAAAAAPVFTFNGTNTVLLGAISVSGPVSRFTPEIRKSVSAPLLAEAKALSSSFGAEIDWT